ncbi:MAG: stage III sporulation protein AB [Firmicutes bacterium]|nr:stage III sporulation protein AB [Bacillota bacterium]
MRRDLAGHGPRGEPGGPAPPSPLSGAVGRRHFSGLRLSHPAGREADLPLSDEDRGLLAEFGQVLGRYDGASQQRALQALLDRLGEQAETARQTARRLVRVDVTLGVTAGLFCLILL